MRMWIYQKHTFYMSKLVNKKINLTPIKAINNWFNADRIINIQWDKEVDLDLAIYSKLTCWNSLSNGIYEINIQIIIIQNGF